MENTNLDSPVDEAYFFNKPSLVLRIKSTLIDTIVLIGLAYLLTLLLESMSIISVEYRGIAIAIVMLYEPIFIVLGGTIGQRFMGLRVCASKDFIENEQKKNINFINSILRYFSKIILGWISLLTIHSNTYGQALHDQVGKSIMTFK